MAIGIVKFFNSNKGYGFIKIENDDDIFVHYSDIIDKEKEFKSLNIGDKVEFDIVQEEKGLKAKNVKILEKTSIIEHYKQLGYSRRSFLIKIDSKSDNKIKKKEEKFKPFDEWFI